MVQVDSLDYTSGKLIVHRYILSLVHRGEILTYNDYQGWENWLFENMKISNSPYPPPLHPWNLEIHS